LQVQTREKKIIRENYKSEEKTFIKSLRLAIHENLHELLQLNTDWKLSTAQKRIDSHTLRPITTKQLKYSNLMSNNTTRKPKLHVWYIIIQSMQLRENKHEIDIKPSESSIDYVCIKSSNTKSTSMKHKHSSD
jgi:hypothetical protein